MRNSAQTLKNNSETNSWLHYLKKSGPAFLASGLNIGSASVTNAVILASASGFLFGWVFFLATFAIYVATLACVKVTAASGKDPIEAMSTGTHPLVGKANGIAILIVNFVFYTIQIPLGGAAINAIFPAIPVMYGAFIVIAIVTAFVLIPKIRMLENVLKYFLYGLAAVYLTSLFVVPIDWSGFFSGVFSFTVPQQRGDIILFTGALGAALAINVPVMQAYASKSSKFSSEQFKLITFETTLTNLLLLFVQFSVLIVVASTLFASEIMVRSPVEAGLALKPIAGPFSTVVFSLGLLGAVITTMVMQTAVAGYVTSELCGWKRDVGSKKFKTVQFIFLGIALCVPLFQINPFEWVVWGAALNTTFMPLGIATWWYMINSEKTMGTYRARSLMNIGLAITFLISITVALRFWISTFS